MNKVRFDFTKYEQETESDREQIKLLWQECFNDPQGFFQYYFTDAVRKSVILLTRIDTEIIGMIHLNPYETFVEGKKEELHYVVGVCVREKYRGAGIMTQMLKLCMDYLGKRGESVVFLMPEQENYYISSGFRRIMDTINVNVQLPGKLTADNNKIRMTPMSEAASGELFMLSEAANAFQIKKGWLSTVKSAEYYSAYSKEHRCQGGDGYIIYHDGKIAAAFGMDIYEEGVYVERMEIFSENTEQHISIIAAVTAFAAECKGRRLELTLAAEYKEAAIAALSAIKICDVDYKISQGKGFMAAVLCENDENLYSKITKKSFFDEIV